MSDDLNETCGDSANRFCRIICDVLEQHGVRDVVCSPGSRNTPLLLAVAARKGLRHHVVIDERSAAFMALGFAQVSRRPVAVVCTSGTAVLNYAPAVAEAYYQALPLIVISADRPEPWIDQDDSQTIRQNGVLSQFVKRSFDLPAVCAPDDEMVWFANRIANDAMLEALSSRPGPVHINMRFAPPLEKMAPRVTESCRIIKMLQGDATLNRECLNRLAAETLSRKVMIVAGFMPPSERLNRAMKALAEMPQVVIMAETLSNLHLDAQCYSVDSVLTRVPEVSGKEYQPDLVISVGGAIVSRKIKEYLRRIPALEHWGVGFQHATVDCFQALTLRIEADPAEFFIQLSGRMRRLMGKKQLVVKEEDYKLLWREAKSFAIASLKPIYDSCQWSDMLAYGLLLQRLPLSANLFLSNGTSVRYAQIFSSRVPHASFCNRGVSGIDGSSSTAIGGAKVYMGGLTVLLTGDMSFSYDIGALQLKNIPETMRIAVISNGGGGIFRFISSTSNLPKDILEEFFCVNPALDIKTIAAAFGWNYLKADSKESLEEASKSFYDSTYGKTILEIVTPPDVSSRILSDFLHN